MSNFFSETKIYFRIFGKSAVILLFLVVTSCNKLVSIPEPSNTITTPETFSNEANATAAIDAIYSNMDVGRGSAFSSGYTTFIAGMSADELQSFGYSSPYQINDVQFNDGSPYSYFWAPAYFDIYLANSALDGISASTTLLSSLKDELSGEAKFVRAFCHFYLVNLFGDVPLVTTDAYAITSLLPRTPKEQVYSQIISDLQYAQSVLPLDYSVSGGERTRANKWAATALLARVYLYTGDYSNAKIQASQVINQVNLYGLDSDLHNVFVKNDIEAILQLQTVNTSYFATLEGRTFIPGNPNQSPNYYLSDDLLAAFELGDQRRSIWVDSSNIGGTFYYYPFKYEIRNAVSATEYYMLLRFAEQYLIRAEAESESGNQQDLQQAITDLNVIRKRAGLPDYSGPVVQDTILNAIQHEKRIEFFAEWGHRWLDLKRWGIAIQTLDTIPYKMGHIDSTQLLYPIPVTEIQTDPNLKQNPGY